MQVKFILVADAVNFTGERKLNITGEFNTITTAGLPMVFPLMCVVARLEANVDEGLKHEVQLRLADEDGTVLFESAALTVEFGFEVPEIPARADVSVSVVGALFGRVGDYSWRAIVDGEACEPAAPLYVRLAPPTSGG
jgi:hypothetical protein